MKKKILLVVLLLLIFLVASYASVGAKTGTRVTGSMNYPDPFSLELDPPRGWGQINFIIDSEGNPEGNATGFAKFTGYTTVDKQPKDFSWYGSAVCGEIVDYGRNPAVVVVVQIKEATHLPLNQYLKFIIVDGGQNASEDMLGLIGAFPSLNKPSCSFEGPWMSWYAVGGNVTIH